MQHNYTKTYKKREKWPLKKTLDFVITGFDTKIPTNLADRDIRACCLT